MRRVTKAFTFTVLKNISWRNKMEVLAARALYFLKCSLHARQGFIPPRTRKIIVVLARTLVNAHANLQPYLFKYVISARNPPQWRIQLLNDTVQLHQVWFFRDMCARTYDCKNGLYMHENAPWTTSNHSHTHTNCVKICLNLEELYGNIEKETLARFSKVPVI